MLEFGGVSTYTSMHPALMLCTHLSSSVLVNFLHVRRYGSGRLTRGAGKGLGGWDTGLDATEANLSRYGGSEEGLMHRELLSWTLEVLIEL